MKIENKLVTKLLLTDLDRLDPISVIIENYKPGAGRIIIECYGRVWTYYWGSMSGQSVQEFFKRCATGYLVDKLEPSEDKNDIMYAGTIIEFIKIAFNEMAEEPEAESETEIKLCKDCKHYTSNKNESDDRCERPVAGSLVRGGDVVNYNKCIYERCGIREYSAIEYPNACGEEGKHFEPKNLNTQEKLVIARKGLSIPVAATHIAVNSDGRKVEPCKVFNTDYVSYDVDEEDKDAYYAVYDSRYWTFFAIEEL